MQPIRVGFSALDENAARLQTTYNEMVAQIEDLEAAVQTLLPTWDGAAQQNYLQCQTQWRTAEQNISQVVQALSGKVAESNDLYQAMEQQNAAMFTF